MLDFSHLKETDAEVYKKWTSDNIWYSFGFEWGINETGCQWRSIFLHTDINVYNPSHCKWLS